MLVFNEKVLKNFFGTFIFLPHICIKQTYKFYMRKFVKWLIFFICFIIFINFLGVVLLKNIDIGISLIGEGIPIVRAVNEEVVGISLISYVDIIKDKLMSENVFVELPEDLVELEITDIKEEKVIEEIEEEEIKIEGPDIKSVTLDWKNEFKNNTKYSVDIESLKKENLSFDVEYEGVEVLIYHTHTTETYTKLDDDEYEYSGDFRTLDKNYNVVKVGSKVKELLEKKGIGVYHDQEIYDYPSYNLSYSKAGKAISALTKRYKKANVVLDIHRDALGTKEQIYKPVVNIGGEDVAQILLVVGSNQGGLTHGKWRENLKFALKIQQIANEKYPGLCRYVILRKERFNQHVAPGALIVEMGATGNTMDEVLRSAELFTDILTEVID